MIVAHLKIYAEHNWSQTRSMLERSRAEVASDNRSNSSTPAQAESHAVAEASWPVVFAGFMAMALI